MRVFEVLFIVAPNVEEADYDALITSMSDVLTSQGARVVKVDRMGRRRLAYPIQKFKDGYYAVLTVEGTGQEIAEVERKMRVVDTIIRYLTIRIDEDLKRAEKFKARRALRMANRRSHSSSGSGHRSAERHSTHGSYQGPTGSTGQTAQPSASPIVQSAVQPENGAQDEEEQA